MCIIAAKPKGIEMPSEEIIETMWASNRDGAGLMWTENNKVCIEKGFMTLKSFKKKLKDLSKRIDLKETPIVMHFRITTHGGTKPQNCHPFPVVESVGALQKLSFKTNVGVAHNGIIDIKPRKNISDTMEYIISQLAPLKQIRSDFYKNDKCHKLIYNAIRSKMCFLDNKGDIYTIGKFEEDNGILYSNHSYIPTVNYAKWDIWDDYSSGYGSGYGSYNTPIVKRLMWIDETLGYIKTNKGELIEAYNFLIDKNGNVYEYDFNYDYAIKLDGWTAVNYNGLPIKFNEDEADFMDVVFE